MEKVAINAVMAPPVRRRRSSACVLRLPSCPVEAAGVEEFAMHGLLATTSPGRAHGRGSGPLAERVGMNSGGTCALRATGRTSRSAGRSSSPSAKPSAAAKPGEEDRATHGQAGKLRLLLRRADRGLAVGAALGGARPSRGRDRGHADGDRGPARARRASWRASRTCPFAGQHPLARDLAHPPAQLRVAGERAPGPLRSRLGSRSITIPPSSSPHQVRRTAGRGHQQRAARRRRPRAIARDPCS